MKLWSILWSENKIHTKKYECMGCKNEVCMSLGVLQYPQSYRKKHQSETLFQSRGNNILSSRFSVIYHVVLVRCVMFKGGWEKWAKGWTHAHRTELWWVLLTSRGLETSVETSDKPELWNLNYINSIKLIQYKPVQKHEEKQHIPWPTLPCLIYRWLK